MAKIIAFANQKGGVGKTTTCINLAAALAAMQRRILVIDLDPQGNTTMGSGVDKNSQTLTMCDVLMGSKPLSDIIVTASEAGYDLAPANGDLTAADVQLLKQEGREHVLRLALKPIIERYDDIFIDCPPALSMLTVNAFVAAKSVIIPMQCEYYALEGLTALISTIQQIRQTHNPKLTIQGILRTMFDPRNRLAIEVSRQLIDHFGGKVYRTIIPRNIRLAEAPSHGQPGVNYDRYSRGAVAYLTLAGEVLRREEWEEERSVGTSNANVH